MYRDSGNFIDEVTTEETGYNGNGVNVTLVGLQPGTIYRVGVKL